MRVSLGSGRFSALECRSNIFNFLQLLQNFLLLIFDLLLVNVPIEKHYPIIHNSLKLVLYTYQFLFEDIFLLMTYL